MANSVHILIVDDDAQVRRLLRRCFEEENYRVSEAASGRDARNHPLTEIDLVTLDLSLGDESGLETARHIRARSEVPIIMVTGKGETIDRVIGLELGADDYITKPFHVREVLARVRSVIRRTQGSSGAATSPQQVSDSANTWRFEGWEVDFARLEVRSSEGRPCELTTGELRLLEVFVKHANRVLSRDQLMDLLRGADWSPLDRSIDNQVARLRKKIEPDPQNPQFIKTVRNAGYKFVAKVEMP